MRKINLIIEDGYILYNTREEIKREYIALNIFKDGRILDYHHFFYLLKKITEKEHKKSQYEIFISSSEIVHINYMIPKVEDDDIESFLILELKDYLDLDISKYRIKYKSVRRDNEIELSIDLFPIDMVEVFENIFKKYNLKLISVSPKSYLINRNKKFIYFNLYSYELIDNTTSLVKINEKNYNNALEELFTRNNLEGYNIKNILENKYDSELINLEEDFLNICFANFYDELIKIIEFVKEDKIVITGILRDSKLIDILKNKKISYELVREEEFFRNITLNKIEKTYNLKKFIPVVFLLLIIIINLFYNRTLNNKLLNDNEGIKRKNNIKKEVQTKIENTSDREQDYNKLFLKNMKKLESLESENILFTDFTYNKEYFEVKGVCKDKTYLERLNEFNILKKEGYIENNMYKFSLDIKNI